LLLHFFTRLPHLCIKLPYKWSSANFDGDACPIVESLLSWSLLPSMVSPHLKTVVSVYSAFDISAVTLFTPADLYESFLSLICPWLVWQSMLMSAGIFAVSGVVSWSESVPSPVQSYQHHITYLLCFPTSFLHVQLHQ